MISDSVWSMVFFVCDLKQQPSAEGVFFSSYWFIYLSSLIATMANKGGSTTVDISRQKADCIHQ